MIELLELWWADAGLFSLLIGIGFFALALLQVRCQYQPQRHQVYLKLDILCMLAMALACMRYFTECAAPIGYLLGVCLSVPICIAHYNRRLLTNANDTN